MFRRDVYDRRMFLDAARKHRAEIGVFTDTRTIPRAQKDKTVVLEPAILLHYVLDLEDKERWIFQELLDDKRGRLDISGSLLDDIYKDDQLRERLKVHDPTLALPPVPSRHAAAAE